MIEYTGEIISFNKIDFCVLDINSLDFSKGKIGIKKQVTKVAKAKGGEKIQTKNREGQTESVIVANAGDAIFYNNDNDMYIPTSSDGNSWKFDDIEKYDYEIVERGQNNVFVKSTNKAILLVEIIQKPTCIKNAFGENNHQFLYKGATLKKDIKTNQISGIDKSAFNTTWQILQNQTDTQFR